MFRYMGIVDIEIIQLIATIFAYTYYTYIYSFKFGGFQCLFFISNINCYKVTHINLAQVLKNR